MRSLLLLMLLPRLALAQCETPCTLALRHASCLPATSPVRADSPLAAVLICDAKCPTPPVVGARRQNGPEHAVDAGGVCKEGPLFQLRGPLCPGETYELSAGGARLTATVEGERRARCGDEPEPERYAVPLAPAWPKRSGIRWLVPWSEARGFGLGLAGGGTLAYGGDTQGEASNPYWLGGGYVRLGAHYTWAFEDDGLLFEDMGALSWCGHFLCGGMGLAFMPKGAFLGNELGLEVAYTGFDTLSDDRQDQWNVLVRPTLRVSPDHFVQSASLLGAFIPAVGLGESPERGRTWLVEWAWIDHAIRLTTYTAMELRLLVLRFDDEGRRTLGAELGFRLP